MSAFAEGGQMIADLAACDECVEEWADPPRASKPSLSVLLALLIEGLALIAMGAWILAVR